MVAKNQLSEIPLFSELDEEESAALADLLYEKKVAKGSYLVYEDDESQSVMFLVAGKAKVTVSNEEGKEVILAYLRKGEFFGELALLSGEDRSADVVTLSDSSVLVLSGSDFKKHIANYQGLSLALMRELAKRLRRASGKIADLALYDVYKRVAKTLHELAEVEDVDGEPTPVVLNRPTHQELASMVGTSREMVTRALKGLEEDECIFVEGKQRIIIWKMPV